MHTSTITTLVAILGLTSAVAVPGSHRPHHGSVKYCSAPGVCANMDIKDGSDCHTFGSKMTQLTFSPGLACKVFLNHNCGSQAFHSWGTVKNVEGEFHPGSDERAKENGVTEVGSFYC